MSAVRDTTTTRMFITSYWPEGDVHLPRAELGLAPPGHRTRLQRRYRRDRNLVVTDTTIEFDTNPPGPVTELTGMRTRIEFVPTPPHSEAVALHRGPLAPPTTPQPPEGEPLCR